MLKIRDNEEKFVDIKNYEGGNMKVAKILAIAGILMIMLGMTFQVIDYQKQIEKLKVQLDKVATENNRLRAENESLWDNYYMNVTNQEGYEYYEW